MRLYYSEKIEDILGVPKEIDLNAVDVDDDDGDDGPETNE